MSQTVFVIYWVIKTTNFCHLLTAQISSKRNSKLQGDFLGNNWETLNLYFRSSHHIHSNWETSLSHSHTSYRSFYRLLFKIASFERNFHARNLSSTDAGKSGQLCLEQWIKQHPPNFQLPISYSIVFFWLGPLKLTTQSQATHSVFIREKGAS